MRERAQRFRASGLWWLAKGGVAGAAPEPGRARSDALLRSTARTSGTQTTNLSSPKRRTYQWHQMPSIYISLVLASSFLRCDLPVGGAYAGTGGGGGGGQSSGSGHDGGGSGRDKATIRAAKSACILISIALSIGICEEALTITAGMSKVSFALHKSAKILTAALKPWPRHSKLNIRICETHIHDASIIKHATASHQTRRTNKNTYEWCWGCFREEEIGS